MLQIWPWKIIENGKLIRPLIQNVNILKFESESKAMNDWCL